MRALHFEAEIIILDEPTMGLSLKETEKLLRFVDGIRDRGKSAIFIDHNIFHVYSVADRIVILDRGRVAGEFPTSRYSLERAHGHHARGRLDRDVPCRPDPGRHGARAWIRRRHRAA